jgi:hypothetical protein
MQVPYIIATVFFFVIFAVFLFGNRADETEQEKKKAFYDDENSYH